MIKLYRTKNLIIPKIGDIPFPDHGKITKKKCIKDIRCFKTEKGIFLLYAKNRLTGQGGTITIY